MNKPIRTAVLVLSMGGLLPAIAGAHGDMSPADREKKLNKMATELNLTQDQKDKVRSIKEDKYKKMEEAEMNADNQVRALLTPDQQAKFDKMKEKRSH